MTLPRGTFRLVIGIFMSMLIVDGGLRLIEATPLWRILPVVQPILGEPDKDFGFESTPGTSGIWPIENRARLRLNALGLRDVERTLEKPPGTIRIGLLGDSMTEAAQVSQRATFGALAERALRAEGQNVELINLAMAGPSPIRPLLRLEKRGYVLNLDLVVVNSSADAFTAGLLLDDSENPAYVEGKDGSVVRSYAYRQRLSQRYADTFVGRAFIFLYQHSPLIRMLYLRGKEPWRKLLGLQSANAPSQPATPATLDTVARCRAVETALEPHIHLWRDHQPERFWVVAARLLDDFADSTRSHKTDLIYAMRDIALAPPDCSSAAQLRAELIAVIAGEFIRRGIRFVDWNAAVAAIAGSDLSRLHGFGLNRGAGHLNYDGHRAWAAALIKVLDLNASIHPGT